MPEVNRVALFKKHAKTFSFASKFLGKKRIEKIVRLYEFCRIIDDIADEEADYKTSKKQLGQIRTDIAKGLSGDNYTQSFINFINNESLNKRYVLDLLDGVISDCEKSIRIKTQNDLIRYSYQVAGTVGALMCALLGVKEKDRDGALNAAIHLGIAMQLTNIARDIKEDAENDRIYIPQEWMVIKDSASLTREPNESENNAKDSCAKLLALADLYYKSAKSGYAFLPFSSRITILLAGDLYRAIGEKIKKHNYTYWHGRYFVTRYEKVLKSLSLLSHLCAPYFWFRVKSYNNSLSMGIENA